MSRTEVNYFQPLNVTHDQRGKTCACTEMADSQAAKQKGKPGTEAHNPSTQEGEAGLSRVQVPWA